MSTDVATARWHKIHLKSVTIRKAYRNDWFTRHGGLDTDDCEIQDVEGVKRIAPPLTAQTNDSTGLLLIASDSL